MEQVLLAPLLDESQGLRIAGILTVIARLGFNTGDAKAASPGVELLKDDFDAIGSRLIVLRAPDGDLDALLASLTVNPEVIAVDKARAFTMQTNDPYWTGQVSAGLALANLPPAWFLTTGLPSVQVAVVDSGVTEIPELSGRIDAGFNALDPGSGDTSDLIGHGTLIASIIAAEKDNSIGIAGVAPGVHIVPVKACFDYLGVVTCPSPFVADALGWVLNQALDGSVDVVNLSFGQGQDDHSVEYYLSALKEVGVPVAAAAGNGGANGLYFPGRSEHVIGVGGVLPDGSRHPSSNYGTDLDISAPFQTYAIDPISAPVYAEGTSFATPVIAGLLALMKSSTFLEVQNAQYWVSHGAGWNSQTGYGVPDAFNFLHDFACVIFDFNGDRVIDVADEQLISYRYGTWAGVPGFDPKYDVEPDGGNGVININDLQREYGRDNYHCPV